MSVAMANETILARILEHEKCSDQIRIGYTFPTRDLEATADQVLRQYDENLAWCGGMEEAGQKYYVRICIVDAVSLKVLKVVWENTNL
jgi:hypothetical protein